MTMRVKLVIMMMIDGANDNSVNPMMIMTLEDGLSIWLPRSMERLAGSPDLAELEVDDPGAAGVAGLPDPVGAAGFDGTAGGRAGRPGTGAGVAGVAAWANGAPLAASIAVARCDRANSPTHITSEATTKKRWIWAARWLRSMVA